MSLFWAPSHNPSRPKPDETGIVVWESDGVFMYNEKLGDYIIEAQTCLKRQPRVRKDLITWGERLSAALR